MFSAGIHTQWSGIAQGPSPLLRGAAMRFQCPPSFSLNVKAGAQKNRSGSPRKGSLKGMAFSLHKERPKKRVMDRHRTSHVPQIRLRASDQTAKESKGHEGTIILFRGQPTPATRDVMHVGRGLH